MSKNLIEQLNYIFVLKEKNVYKFEQNDLATFIIRQNGLMYIGLPYYGKKINESFVGMNVSTQTLNYECQSINCLCLIADENIDSEKFLLVAEDFAKDANRPILLKNPYDWLDKWRMIFGDRLSNKKVYDVLGELIALKNVFETDKSFTWQGPSGGTHDLVAENRIVEVKSTILKKAYNVSINSSYQLSIEKSTNLYFVRMEKKPYCLTINSIVKELLNLGYPKDNLEKLLTKQGLIKGSRARDESYDLLSIRSYKISKEYFPIFSLENINDNFAPKRNIVGYTLELDLTGIEHDAIFEKE